nr:putative ribonuclease H-like domain-containing protein [Tanacetum cinerariifolium]
LEEQSLDDLFNSLKIYEAEVKSSSSASTSTQNITFVSSQNTDSTNEPVSVVASVSVASAKIPVSALSNVDTLSNVVIYSFFASQSNSLQLDNNDLKQIDDDDLDEMDLKWQMAMLTVRERRFLQRTRRNLRESGPTLIGFDMSKVECYNCQCKGHFARECRSPKDTRRNVSVEPQRRNVPLETSTSNASVSQCDGVGSYDWSFQAEEEPTNYALMGFISSSSSSSNNELRDNALVVFRQKFKKAKQERDELKLKLEKFQTSSKNLSQLLASQNNDKTGLGYDTQVFTSSMIDCNEMFSSETDESFPASHKYDRYQSGERYHAVPPPYTGTFMPPKPELVFHDAPNVNEIVHTDFNVELSLTKPDKDLSHRPSTPIIEDWVSDLDDDSEAKLPQNAPTIAKPKTHGNSMNRKACFVCKSLTYLIKDCNYYEKIVAQTLGRNHAQRGNHQQYARMTHLNPQRHVVPIAALTKSKLVPLTAAIPVTTTVLQPHVTRPRPAKTVVTKPHSPPRRNINHKPSLKPSNFPPKVTTIKALMVNVVKGVQGNWGNPQHALKEKGVIDSGCSRHIKGNMSYLFDFEEINGGYVAFGGNPKGGKITGKGKIKTLDFDDVYFVKELKFNLFSVSQMCDKKNNVLFTDTECIVLSPEFKLPDENQVLLRVPRENNMYNVDLKNIVPSEDLTCLFAKETLDESNIWHRMLSHINFKTMNKLVKGNLVRGLPSKVFKNNHTCVAYKKGKQHRASVRPSLSVLSANPYKGSGPTWLFDIDTLTKSMNYQPVIVGNQSNPSAGVQEQFDAQKAEEDNVQQYVLFPLWSSGSKDPQNTDEDATFEVKKPEFEVKEPEFEVEKPESEVHVSPSSSAQTKKHDDKTKREAKGKIPAVGQISTNSTNTFSAAGPFNTAVSLTHGKSSYTNPSQYPDDPNMLALEDITYSDDEEDVCAEADFTNLETNITEELLQFKMQKVWVLVDFPNEKRAIGHAQEEGIDYEEVFAPVARIEAISLFLTYDSFMGFIVYQMDVKSAFLYETIEEEVYVCQPPGFEDPDYLDKVYKVVKELYGLHQAPRAWYETLANYLLENGFQKGKIDQTLFIKKQKGDILLVQVYVDDIIFGSTNKDLCKAFEKLMKDKFQMSSMGELTFFLGLQVKQKLDGTFISQDKYVAEILRKVALTNGKSASTPIDTEKPLLKNPDGEDVDVHTYRSMIGSLMYLTSSRPDIMFAISQGKATLRPPKDSPFNLVPYSDSDYAGASLDKKSTTMGFQFLGYRLISWQCKKQTVVATSSTEAEYVATNEFSSSMASAVICLSTGRKFHFSKAQVGDLSSHTTKYSSPALTQKLFSIMRRVGKGFSKVETPLFKGMIVAQQADDVVDEVAVGVDVDDVPALMKVEALEQDKVAQDLEIIKLKQRVKKLERKNKLKVSGLRRLRKVGTTQRVESCADTVMDDQEDASKQGEIIANIDADEDVTLKDVAAVENIANDKVKENADDDELEPAELKEVVEVVTTAKLMTEVVTVAAATTPITAATITAAPSAARRRKRRIMVEEPKPLKKQAQIEQDEAYARELEAELNKNINWNDVIKNMPGFKMDYFKGMSYEDIRPIFEKYFNSNVAFLEKSKEQLEEEESRALKRKTESSKEKATKKQKLDEEVEELKKHLQIVPNDDDDVYTEATPLALKVSVVDYAIYSENNKPFYKIIRANGSHQLFLSFLSILRNFDREDLEVLWQLVK